VPVNGNDETLLHESPPRRKAKVPDE
jgi:hypothetical protein